MKILIVCECQFFQRACMSLFGFSNTVDIKTPDAFLNFRSNALENFVPDIVFIHAITINYYFLFQKPSLSMRIYFTTQYWRNLSSWSHGVKIKRLRVLSH